MSMGQNWPQLPSVRSLEGVFSRKESWKKQNKHPTSLAVTCLNQISQDQSVEHGALTTPTPRVHGTHILGWMGVGKVDARKGSWGKGQWALWCQERSLQRARAGETGATGLGVR